MKQDLKTLFKEEKNSENYTLKSGHKERFLDLLEKEMPKKNKSSSRFIFQIAASIILIVSVGIYLYSTINADDTISTTVVEVDPSENDSAIEGFSLGDLSPDLKKVEQYYVANINLELAQLKISKDNKGLIESFMDRLAELNAEYQVLTKELNTLGPNDQTISALIQNLQLRLQLLQKLKEKLNELKSSKNETAISI